MVAHLKHNLSPRGASWLYELVSAEVGSLPQLEWRGTSELTADDLCNAKPADKSAREDAADFLREALANGPRPEQAINAEAKKNGHSERTLARAKKDVGVVSKKDGSRWHWSLPTVEKNDP